MESTAGPLPDVDVALQHVWLFVRGDESVRIQRIRLDDGCALLIEGPGDAEDRRRFPDLFACVSAQSQIERELLMQGFFLEALTERRRRADPNRPAFGDRRRRHRS